MNHKKKLIQRHKNKLRNPEKRLQNSKKPKYISKAKRAELALTELKEDAASLSDEGNES